MKESCRVAPCGGPTRFSVVFLLSAGAVNAVNAVNAAKKRSSGKSKGSKSKGKRGGVREEIRQLQEALGVDDPNRTPQVKSSSYTEVTNREKRETELLFSRDGALLWQEVLLSRCK